MVNLPQISAARWRQDLANYMQRRCDELGAAGQGGAGWIHVHLHDCQSRIRVECLDRLACEIASLEVSWSDHGMMSTAQMKQLADDASARISYLEERLVVMEVDDQAPEIQLRSDVLCQEASMRSYYELIVRPTRLELRRYGAESRQPRHELLAVLTRGTLCRLTADLMDAVAARARD